MFIQLQICGLIMLLLLLAFYKSHKTLDLYPERVFFRTLAITMETVFFDALSVVCICYSESLPFPLVKIVCKLYLTLLIWSAWAVLTYILLDFSAREVQRRATRNWGIFAGVAALVMWFLPIDIYKDGLVVYSLGPAVLTTYIACGIQLLNSFCLSVVLYRRKHSRRAFGGALLVLVWLVAASIQFFNNKLLLVGFSQSLGMLILFVLMENPESYIDKEYNSFNVFGLKPYVCRMYESGKAFYVAHAFIMQDEALADAGHNLDEVIRSFIKSASQVSGAYVFKDTACSMSVIVADEASFDKVLKAVFTEKFSKPYLNGYAKLVSVRHAEKLSGYAELSEVITYVKNNRISKTVEFVEVNEEIIKSHAEESEIIREIDDALTEDRVEVFFQPIFSNKEKNFPTAEALTRIRLKNGRLLSPGLFIPIAEKTGQMIPLGKRILEKVFAFIHDNDMEALGLHYLEVNLSVTQCEQVDLFDTVMQLAEQYQIDPGFICFEITESAAIQSKAIISANVQKLFDAGFSLSLDDFGKGESNLMYVVEMPVSLMKFDIDMTKAYFESYKAKSVLRAVIPMAHDLDLKLVAEGVETARELELLTYEGIDYIQGYFFSKPLPIPEFMAFLRK